MNQVRAPFEQAATATSPTVDEVPVAEFIREVRRVRVRHGGSPLVVVRVSQILVDLQCNSR